MVEAAVRMGEDKMMKGSFSSSGGSNSLKYSGYMVQTKISYYFQVIHILFSHLILILYV